MKAQSVSPISSSHLPGWEFAPVFREKATVQGVNIFLCGMQASHPVFGEMVGSSASLAAFPENSAWYELVERIAIVQSMAKTSFICRHDTTESSTGTVSLAQLFPQTGNPESSYAKSNGVALFSTWHEACRRAAMELVERHLILASWLGYTKPQRMDGVAKSQLHFLKNIYGIEHYDFGRQKVSSFPGSIYATGVILKPKDERYPFILGAGAGQSQAESIQKAEGEAWQRLGFLWGEEIPTTEPDFAPHQLYHQELYLYPKYHERIYAWLRGEFFDSKKPPLASVLNTSFADISIESDPQFRVAKAMAKEAIPLVFGRNRDGFFSGIAQDRLIHPIA